MNNSAKSLSSSNGWMIIYVAHSEPEAYIVAGRLESEGINAWVHQEPVGRAYGISVGPLGEVKVLVRPDDYERGLAILDDADYESDGTEITLEDEADYEDDADTDVE